MVSKGFPNNVVKYGQRYNIGEKTTVNILLLLYTHLNRHAGTAKKTKTFTADVIFFQDHVYIRFNCTCKSPSLTPIRS